MIDFFNNTKIIIKYKIFDILNIINGIIGLKFYLIDINVWKNYNYYFINYFRNYLIINKGELNKNFFYVFKVISYLNKFFYTKKTYLIAIGGGVTGDIAGLVSAIFLRGIYLVHVPTTIISQVDSSIGGKNGVNMKKGKNIIGTIYQPLYILIAIEFLKSLLYIDLYYGFSEIIKIMIINCPFLYNLLFNKYIVLNNKLLFLIIKYSICGKIIILRKDLYDNSYRLKLNLGHTFGHALESYSNYLIPHSISIFIGLYLSSLFSICYNKLPILDFIKIYFIIFNWFPLLFNILFNNILGMVNYFSYDKKRNNNIIKIIIIKKLGKVLIKKYNIFFLINFCYKIFLVNELIKQV